MPFPERGFRRSLGDINLGRYSAVGSYENRNRDGEWSEVDVKDVFKMGNGKPTCQSLLGDSIRTNHFQAIPRET